MYWVCHELDKKEMENDLDGRVESVFSLGLNVSSTEMEWQRINFDDRTLNVSTLPTRLNKFCCIDFVESNLPYWQYDF
jgi:hypothetical protein